MSFISRWFWPRSVRSEALSLYKGGLACAEKEDSKAAMDAYTAAIELPDAPDDVKAMALYNRALLFAAAGRTDKALADLQTVMEMPMPMHGIKLAARRRLERLHHRQEAAARADQRSTT
jgi:tetratricopeptide (TPR) repeat protein